MKTIETIKENSEFTLELDDTYKPPYNVQAEYSEAIRRFQSQIEPVKLAENFYLIVQENIPIIIEHIFCTREPGGYLYDFNFYKCEIATPKFEIIETD